MPSVCGQRPPAAGAARVTVVLPTVQRLPAGGYKVSYEYANRLARRGHDVTIVHPAGALSNNLGFWRSQARHLAGVDRSAAGLVPWFDFDRSVSIRLVPLLNERWLPDADVTLLTGWSTVRAVRSVGLRSPRIGLVGQLVMDYELWLDSTGVRRQRIEAQLSRAGIRKVAISEAARSMLRIVGSDADDLVTLGVELDLFGVSTPPADRSPVVGFPLRGQRHKGAADAFQAAELVAAARPGVRWVCFGGGRAPDPPDVVESLGSVAPQRLAELYNRCAVFVLPSWAEGWGLPAAEAMACGAAVVTTANGGTESFAIDGVNALVVPPRDPSSLADAVVRLLDDHELRLRLVAEGRRTVELMTWERATDQLCGALDLVGPGGPA